jgi:hypothetical protein
LIKNENWLIFEDFAEAVVTAKLETPKTAA